MKTLELIFRMADGSSRRVISIPNPVADIDTVLDDLETHIGTYLSPILIDPATYDEATVIDKTVTNLVNKM